MATSSPNPENDFPVQSKEQRPYHYGVADMTTRDKKIRENLSEEGINLIVVQQADNDSEWEEPVRFTEASSASLSSA